MLLEFIAGSRFSKDHVNLSYRAMMFRDCFATSLALFLPLQVAAQDTGRLTPRDQIERPYVALFDLSGPEYSLREVARLRGSIQQERKQQLDTCHSEEKRLRSALESARKGLFTINESAPSDNVAAAGARTNLHAEIAALEHMLPEKQRECEHTLPAAFEIKLAKAQLVEHWPRQRDSVDRIIDEGQLRHRKHGDVDDIGYRKLVGDPEKDIPIGDQAFRQMTSSKLMPAELQDFGIRLYVKELAGKIARNSDLKVPLRVTLLESDEVNAVALPGGFLVLTSGLLLTCETESELAGVISQQIAHIAARHGTRPSKLSVLSKGFVPAAQVVTGLFTGGVSNAGAYYGMNYGFQGLSTLVDRAMSHSNGKALTEADQLGIQYAWKAGFDPKGFIAFLDSAAKAKDYSKTRTFLITKPSLGERLVDAFSEIQYLPAKDNYITDSAEFRAARERLLTPNTR